MLASINFSIVKSYSQDPYQYYLVFGDGICALIFFKNDRINNDITTSAFLFLYNMILE